MVEPTLPISSSAPNSDTRQLGINGGTPGVTGKLKGYGISDVGGFLYRRPDRVEEERVDRSGRVRTLGELCRYSYVSGACSAIALPLFDMGLFFLMLIFRFAPFLPDFPPLFRVRAHKGGLKRCFP